MINDTSNNTIVFIDGQNLFYAAKEAFGYSYPNYDPLKLARAVCKKQNWGLSSVYFYTGIPSQDINPYWHDFWARKLAVMGTRGIHAVTRPLRYNNETISLSDGTTTKKLVGREKGIDIRIALDIVRFSLEKRMDVALIFSQDQDLIEVVDEVKMIARREQHWITIASAFPVSSVYENCRGINGTQWIKMDKQFYDSCIDPNSYRQKP
jgi:uncharacterized LabA/DUF88 family protein